jgi:hypothetical protein
MTYLYVTENKIVKIGASDVAPGMLIIANQKVFLVKSVSRVSNDGLYVHFGDSTLLLNKNDSLEIVASEPTKKIAI